MSWWDPRTGLRQKITFHFNYVIQQSLNISNSVRALNNVIPAFVFGCCTNTRVDDSGFHLYGTQMSASDVVEGTDHS